MSDAVEIAELARVLSLTTTAAAALEREGLPVTKRKKRKLYPLAKCVAWYVDYRLRKAPLPPRTTPTRFAQLVSITSRNVSYLIEKGLPTIVEGGTRTLPLPDAVHWYIKYRVAQAGGAGEALNDLDKMKLRKLEAETQQQEIQLMKTRGELVDRVTVERLLADILQSLRAEMLNFPARWADDFLGCTTRLEMRQRVKHAINEALARLGSAATAAGERIQIVEEDEHEDAATREEGEPDLVEQT